MCVCLYVRTHTQELLPIIQKQNRGKNPKEDAGRASINHSLSAFEKKNKNKYVIYIYKVGRYIIYTAHEYLTATGRGLNGLFM